VPSSFPFDDMAADYDDDFSRSKIGKLMRRRVWTRLDSCFAPGQRVLEVNCGTGEDAIYLGNRGIDVVATDLSAEMVSVTREKVKTAKLEGRIRVAQVGLESLHDLSDQVFDGVLSNFGGLNCVANRKAVSTSLAACVRPGGTVLLCVMGPVVPWEWVWFLAHGKPGEAFRRLKRGGADWQGLKIHYPTISTLRREFSPQFRFSRVAAIGALLPPPYTEHWTERKSGWLERLNKWESKIETFPPMPSLADHYLLELIRI
jgi:ubiquinone/menaquinone biosynthesis C-methylase UbiE